MLFVLPGFLSLPSIELPILFGVYPNNYGRDNRIPRIIYVAILNFFRFLIYLRNCFKARETL